MATREDEGKEEEDGGNGEGEGATAVVVTSFPRLRGVFFSSGRGERDGGGEGAPGPRRRAAARSGEELDAAGGGRTGDDRSRDHRHLWAGGGYDFGFESGVGGLSRSGVVEGAVKGGGGGGVRRW